MGDFINSLRDQLPQLTNYLVYAAIAIVTIIGVGKCLLPLYITTHSLRRAISRLQDQAGETGERPVWQESRFMGKRLKGCWLRFLQNAEQLDRRGLPCNVEDYINDDTVTHGPGNAQLAELVPSLLTSLGILGTFMGMTQGLTGLDLSTTDAMMQGIQGLLGGMRFAFGTSVAGVSCALVFNMLNRIAQGSSYRAIDDFVESFTQLAMQRPLDNDVQLICQNQDRNHLLGTVTDTISTSMSSSIELAISRAMTPVAQSMDNFLVGATRGQVEGVQRIVNNFVDRMNSSLNGQFLLLGQTLSDLNQQQQISQERLNQSLDSAAAITGEVRQLQSVSQGVLREFEHYVSELTDARIRDGQFEQDASDLLGSMKKSADQQAALLSHLKDSEENLGRSMAQFMKSGADNSLVLQHIGQDMKTSGDTLSASCGDFVGQVSELSACLGSFKAQMEQLTLLMQRYIDSLPADGVSGDTAKQLSALQRQLTQLTETLQKTQTDAEVTPKGEE